MTSHPPRCCRGLRRFERSAGGEIRPELWQTGCRLAKNYENLADILLAFVTLASIQFAIRRLARRWALE